MQSLPAQPSKRQSLQTQQIAAGATLTDKGIPASFGNEAAAHEALQTGIAIYDSSDWGKIKLTGADRLRFLHNQTTNDFNILQPGQSCDTVFVTSTARTIDLVTAYVLEDSVLLLTSPGYSQTLIDWMDRFIFFADKVELHDLTDHMASFSLIGAEAMTLLEKLGVKAIVGQAEDSHQICNLNFAHLNGIEVNGIEARIAVGSGLKLPGYRLFVDREQAADLWKGLVEAGAVPMGEDLWQQLRVEQGRPAPNQELTDDYNPLEAGLWHTISLSKGCYIGQETIARLHTYKGVKQQLWGIRLASSVEPESLIMASDEKVGRITSVTQTSDGYLALAYIRTKNAAPGLEVTVGEATGTLVELPFVSHEYI
jgi:tRNA-modifying protein YgfZ